MGFSAPASDDDPIAVLVQDMEKGGDEIGLYLRSVVLSQQLPDGNLAPVHFNSVDELTNMVRTGAVSLKMVVAFQVGDLAFSDRIENPAKYEMDVQAQEILPPEHQLLVDNARAEAEAKGIDPIDALLGLDDDDEDD